MAKLVGMIALAWLLVFAFGTAEAQITIMDTDVQTVLAPGNILTEREDRNTTSVNIGAPGLTSWDFSSLRADTATTYTSVLASSSPHFSEFPTATHAFKVLMSVEYSGILISGFVYQYFRLGANFENLGNMGDTTVGTPPFAIPVVLKTNNTPAEIVYGLPATIGTTWSTSYTSTLVISAFGTPYLTTVTTHNARYEVDAYGLMTLPGGYGTYDALRLRKVDLIKRDTLPAYWAQSYTFLAKNGASVEVTACDTTVLSGVIPLCGGLNWTAPFFTDVQAADAMPTEIRLRQNYPNPFNPVTTIGYDLPAKAQVTLKVYDLLGREVAVLVDGVQEPGYKSATFDAGGLASGVYFYRLQTSTLSGQAGDFVATKRLLLLR